VNNDSVVKNENNKKDKSKEQDELQNINNFK